MSSYSSVSIPVDAIEVVAELTLELTKLKLEKCEHLCIQNFSSEVFEKLMGGLLRVYYGDGA